ncbi:MAG: T9SS type A sorting domain-containing protein [Bacteroidales bacterium]|nr:T9SS type A sorting domain-containing protein [Bacteroidales bacterium]
MHIPPYTRSLQGNTQSENTSNHQYVIHNLQNANYYWRVKSVCSFGESNFVNGNNIVTGITNHNNEQMLQLYPNPTKDLVNVQLTINNEQLGEVGIQVFDVYGRLLEVINMADARGASLQTAQIDLSQYAKGVYFVKAVSEGKVIAVRKVVKR